MGGSFRVEWFFAVLFVVLLSSCTVLDSEVNESGLDYLLELQRNNTLSQELILQTTKQSYGPGENVTLIVATTGAEYYRTTPGVGEPYTVNRIFPNGTIQSYPRVCRAIPALSTESFSQEPTPYTWERLFVFDECGIPINAPSGTYFFSINPDYFFFEGSQQYVNISAISNTFELE